MLPSPRTYAFWLALMRIYLGAFWLEHGLGKFRLNPPFGAPGGFLSNFLAGNIAKSSGPYHDFLVGVVQPNLSTFAFLVQFGEITTGALLLLGLFTRLGGFVGAVLALNYFLSKDNLSSGSAYAGLDILTAVACALNVVLPTGRFLGLDAFGARRRPVVTNAAPPTAPPPIVTPPPRP